MSNDFENFKKLLEEGGKEDEDFKNIWESPKDENSFYKKINEIVRPELDPAIDDVAITLEVQFDYDLFYEMNRVANEHSIVFITPKAKDPLRGMNRILIDDELNEETSLKFEFLKEHQFSKEQYKTLGLFKSTRNNNMTQEFIFSDSDSNKEKLSDISYDPRLFLNTKAMSVDQNHKFGSALEFIISQKHPYIPQSSFENQRLVPFICPLTGKDYYLKPSFSEHLKDIDHFVADAQFKIKSLYNCSFLYKDENWRSYIPFPDLLQLEKEYSKRWNKIKKIKDRQNEVRLQIKGRCWIIRKLLKKYKHYIHLNYLRELFIKNKGNSITYRDI